MFFGGDVGLHYSSVAKVSQYSPHDVRCCGVRLQAGVLDSAAPSTCKSKTKQKSRPSFVETLFFAEGVRQKKPVEFTRSGNDAQGPESG